MSSETVFILPDILANWPWNRVMNPHSSPQMKAESLEWIQSFASTPHMQRVFDHGEFALLSFLAYPLENKDILRAGYDLINWLFLYDETSDLMTPHEAQQLGALVLDAMRNPDRTRPAQECVVVEATRQLWKSMSKCSSAAARGRLMQSLENYTTAVAIQAQDRALEYIRDIDEYLPVRRETAGIKLAFAVLEFELNLPDEFFEDPLVQSIFNACIDIINISNDLYSYNVEQARGDGSHNLVTILMHHRNFTLTEAVAWIGDYATKHVQSVLNNFDHVPWFGEEYQAGVERYLNGLCNWVRANDSWHFESGRYFGMDGLEIQKTRKVVLLP